MKKKVKGTLIIAFISISLVCLYFYLHVVEKNKQVTVPVTIEKDVTHQVLDSITEDEKMEEYILSGLHDKEIFKEFHSHTKNEFESKDYPIYLLFTGIEQNDIEIFLSGFSTYSIQESFGHFSKLTERERFLKQVISDFSRGNTLKSIQYQLKLDSYDQETNEGNLIFLYQGLPEVQVDIKLIESINHGEKSFLIDTPITDILKEIENAQHKEQLP
ncbi:hypothetical protein [Cytobacillus purgationiresistens]|uniref:Uncharacterized protein n=1 Tax=Cytobacillus purgationiresistens TaxID=863449 RepID=A0ABU0AQJ4_9BACI|nr:hypothetical protein [Cytobacillus purgationiresistens]MDQ0273490.1 hypothetical protein [Cytobacillus purgationiresistens]